LVHLGPRAYSVIVKLERFIWIWPDYCASAQPRARILDKIADISHDQTLPPSAFDLAGTFSPFTHSSRIHFVPFLPATLHIFDTKFDIVPTRRMTTEIAKRSREIAHYANNNNNRTWDAERSNSARLVRPIARLCLSWTFDEFVVASAAKNAVAIRLGHYQIPHSDIPDYGNSITDNVLRKMCSIGRHVHWQLLTKQCDNACQYRYILYLISPITNSKKKREVK